jgi:hypothetical protein
VQPRTDTAAPTLKARPAASRRPPPRRYTCALCRRQAMPMEINPVIATLDDLKARIDALRGYL